MPISMTITAEKLTEYLNLVQEFANSLPQRTTAIRQESQYELTDAGRAGLAKDALDTPPQSATEAKLVTSGLTSRSDTQTTSDAIQEKLATIPGKPPLDWKAGDPLPDDLAPEPAKRGRKPKDKTATVPTTIEPEKPVDAVRPTLEHIQARIVGVLQNATAKFAGDANPSASVKSYILRMLGEFGVAKASDLPVEKYAEFLTASKAYLEGTA